MIDLAREVYTEIEKEWQLAIPEYERQIGQPFPCSAGCAACCKASDSTTPFIMLSIGQPEAALLWETLKSLPEEMKRFLLQRYREHYSRACLLLSEDDRCLAYEGRPFWCRVFGLSGMPICGKVKPVKIERWSQAVHDAHARLRAESGSFVSIRQIVGELERK